MCLFIIKIYTITITPLFKNIVNTSWKHILLLFVFFEFDEIIKLEFVVLFYRHFLFTLIFFIYGS